MAQETNSVAKLAGSPSTAHRLPSPTHKPSSLHLDTCGAGGCQGQALAGEPGRSCASSAQRSRKKAVTRGAWLATHVAAASATVSVFTSSRYCFSRSTLATQSVAAFCVRSGRVRAPGAQSPSLDFLTQAGRPHGRPPSTRPTRRRAPPALRSVRQGATEADGAVTRVGSEREEALRPLAPAGAEARVPARARTPATRALLLEPLQSCTAATCVLPARLRR